MKLKQIPNSYINQSNDLVKEDSGIEDILAYFDFVKDLDDEWKKKNRGEYYNNLQDKNK